MNHPSLLDSSPGSDAAAISMVPIHVQHASLKPMVLGMSAQHCTVPNNSKQTDSRQVATCEQSAKHSPKHSKTAVHLRWWLVWSQPNEPRLVQHRVTAATACCFGCSIAAAAIAAAALPLVCCVVCCAPRYQRLHLHQHAIMRAMLPGLLPPRLQIQHMRHTVHARVSSMAMRICDRRGLLPVASQVLS